MPQLRLAFALLSALALLLTGCPSPPRAPANLGSNPTPQPQVPDETSEVASELTLQLQYEQMPRNTWLSGAPLVHARGGVAAGSVSGRLFAIGGDSEATVEVYDPSSDTWRLSYLPPEGHAATWPRARHFGAAVSSQGRLFYVGGSNTWLESRLDVYHPDTHQWLDATGRTVESAFFQRTGLAAVAYDGRITLLGGEMPTAAGGTAATDSVVTFYPDVTTGWSELYLLAPLPQPRAGLGAATLADQLFVVGGYEVAPATGSPTATPSMWVYRTNAWVATTPNGIPLASLNTPRHSFGSTVVDGKWVVAGGLDSQGRVLDSVEVYDPASNRWTIAAPMPLARVHLALAPLNGRVFAVGGYDADGRPLRRVDVFRP